jgi:hypothetical protein
MFTGTGFTVLSEMRSVTTSELLYVDDSGTLFYADGTPYELTIDNVHISTSSLGSVSVSEDLTVDGSVAAGDVFIDTYGGLGFALSSSSPAIGITAAPLSEAKGADASSAVFVSIGGKGAGTDSAALVTPPASVPAGLGLDSAATTDADSISVTPLASPRASEVSIRQVADISGLPAVGVLFDTDVAFAATSSTFRVPGAMQASNLAVGGGISAHSLAVSAAADQDAHITSTAGDSTFTVSAPSGTASVVVASADTAYELRSDGNGTFSIAADGATVLSVTADADAAVGNMEVNSLTSATYIHATTLKADQLLFDSLVQSVGEDVALGVQSDANGTASLVLGAAESGDWSLTADHADPSTPTLTVGYDGTLAGYGAGATAVQLTATTSGFAIDLFADAGLTVAASDISLGTTAGPLALHRPDAPAAAAPTFISGQTSTTATGGDLTVTAGAASGASVGGDLVLDAGAAGLSGTGGAVTVGANSASSVALGSPDAPVTVGGGLTVAGSSVVLGTPSPSAVSISRAASTGTAGATLISGQASASGVGGGLVLSSGEGPTAYGSVLVAPSGGMVSLGSAAAIVTSAGDFVASADLTVNGAGYFSSTATVQDQLRVAGTTELIGSVRLGSLATDFVMHRGQHQIGAGMSTTIVGQVGAENANGGRLTLTGGTSTGATGGDLVLDGGAGTTAGKARLGQSSSATVIGNTTSPLGLFGPLTHTGTTASFSGDVSVAGTFTLLGDLTAGPADADWTLGRPAASDTDGSGTTILGQAGSLTGGDLRIRAGDATDTTDGNAGGDLILDGGLAEGLIPVLGAVFVGRYSSRVDIAALDADTQVHGDLVLGESDEPATLRRPAALLGAGAATVISGQAGASGAAGGDLTVVAGAGLASSPGGDLIIDGGSSESGVPGSVSVGAASDSVVVSASGHVTRIQGSTVAVEGLFGDADLLLDAPAGHALLLAPDTADEVAIGSAASTAHILSHSLSVDGTSTLIGNLTLGTDSGAFVVTRPTTAGPGTTTSFLGQSGVSGGDMMITAGSASTGTGGDLVLDAGAAISAGAAYGDVLVGRTNAADVLISAAGDHQTRVHSDLRVDQGTELRGDITLGVSNAEDPIAITFAPSTASAGALLTLTGQAGASGGDVAIAAGSATAPSGAAGNLSLDAGLLASGSSLSANGVVRLAAVSASAEIGNNAGYVSLRVPTINLGTNATSDLTIARVSAFANAAGGATSILGQNAVSTGFDGGSVTIVAGSAADGGSTAGELVLNPGPVGLSPSVRLATRGATVTVGNDPATAGVVDSQLVLWGSSFFYGDLTMTGASARLGPSGADLVLSRPSAAQSDVTAHDTYLFGQAAHQLGNAKGGDLLLAAGTGVGSNGDGGDLYLDAGTGSVSGATDDGLVVLGSHHTSGVHVDAPVIVSAATAITAPLTVTADTVFDEDVFLQGSGVSYRYTLSADDASVSLTAWSDPATTGAAGSIELTAGSAMSGSGGDVEVNAGAGTTSGTVLLAPSSGHVELANSEAASLTTVHSRLLVGGVLTAQAAQMVHTGSSLLLGANTDYTISRPAMTVTGAASSTIIAGQTSNDSAGGRLELTGGTGITTGGTIAIDAGVGGSQGTVRIATSRGALVVGDGTAGVATFNSAVVMNETLAIDEIDFATGFLHVPTNGSGLALSATAGDLYIGTASGETTHTETLHVTDALTVDGQSNLTGLAYLQSHLHLTTGEITRPTAAAGVSAGATLILRGQETIAAASTGGDVAIIGGVGLSAGGDVVLTGGAAPGSPVGGNVYLDGGNGAATDGSVYVGARTSTADVFVGSSSTITHVTGKLYAAGEQLILETQTSAGTTSGVITRPTSIASTSSPTVLKGQANNGTGNGGDVHIQAGTSSSANAGIVKIGSSPATDVYLSALHNAVRVADDLYVGGDVYLMKPTYGTSEAVVTVKPESGTPTPLVIRGQVAFSVTQAAGDLHLAGGYGVTLAGAQVTGGSVYIGELSLMVAVQAPTIIDSTLTVADGLTVDDGGASIDGAVVIEGAPYAGSTASLVRGAASAATPAPPALVLQGAASTADGTTGGSVFVVPGEGPSAYGTVNVGTRRDDTNLGYASNVSVRVGDPLSGHVTLQGELLLTGGSSKAVDASGHVGSLIRLGLGNGQATYLLQEPSAGNLADLTLRADRSLYLLANAGAVQLGTASGTYPTATDVNIGGVATTTSILGTVVVDGHGFFESVEGISGQNTFIRAPSGYSTVIGTNSGDATTPKFTVANSVVTSKVEFVAEQAITLDPGNAVISVADGSTQAVMLVHGQDSTTGAGGALRFRGGAAAATYSTGPVEILSSSQFLVSADESVFTTQVTAQQELKTHTLNVADALYVSYNAAADTVSLFGKATFADETALQITAPGSAGMPGGDLILNGGSGTVRGDVRVGPLSNVMVASGGLTTRVLSSLVVDGGNSGAPHILLGTESGDPFLISRKARTASGAPGATYLAGQSTESSSSDTPGDIVVIAGHRDTNSAITGTVRVGTAVAANASAPPSTPLFAGQSPSDVAISGVSKTTSVLGKLSVSGTSVFSDTLLSSPSGDIKLMAQGPLGTGNSLVIGYLDTGNAVAISAITASVDVAGKPTQTMHGITTLEKALYFSPVVTGGTQTIKVLAGDATDLKIIGQTSQSVIVDAPSGTVSVPASTSSFLVAAPAHFSDAAGVATTALVASDDIETATALRVSPTGHAGLSIEYSAADSAMIIGDISSTAASAGDVSDIWLRPLSAGASQGSLRLDGQELKAGTNPAITTKIIVGHTGLAAPVSVGHSLEIASGSSADSLFTMKPASGHNAVVSVASASDASLLLRGQDGGARGDTYLLGGVNTGGAAGTVYVGAAQDTYNTRVSSSVYISGSGLTTRVRGLLQVAGDTSLSGELTVAKIVGAAGLEVDLDGQDFIIEDSTAAAATIVSAAASGVTISVPTVLADDLLLTKAGGFSVSSPNAVDLTTSGALTVSSSDGVGSGGLILTGDTPRLQTNQISLGPAATGTVKPFVLFRDSNNSAQSDFFLLGADGDNSVVPSDVYLLPGVGPLASGTGQRAGTVFLGTFIDAAMDPKPGGLASPGTVTSGSRMASNVVVGGIGTLISLLGHVEANNLSTAAGSTDHLTLNAVDGTLYLQRMGNNALSVAPNPAASTTNIVQLLAPSRFTDADNLFSNATLPSAYASLASTGSLIALDTSSGAGTMIVSAGAQGRLRLEAGTSVLVTNRPGSANLVSVTLDSALVKVGPSTFTEAVITHDAVPTSAAAVALAVLTLRGATGSSVTKGGPVHIIGGTVASGSPTYFGDVSVGTDGTTFSQLTVIDGATVELGSPGNTLSVLGTLTAADTAVIDLPGIEHPSSSIELITGASHSINLSVGSTTRLSATPTGVVAPHIFTETVTASPVSGSNTGIDVTVAGGASPASQAGDLLLLGGAGAVHGDVYVGVTQTTNVHIGAAGVDTNVQGDLRVTGAIVLDLSSTGTAGSATMIASSPGAGSGHNIELVGSDAVGGNFTGGSASVDAGAGAGTGTAGNVAIGHNVANVITIGPATSYTELLGRTFVPAGLFVDSASTVATPQLVNDAANHMLLLTAAGLPTTDLHLEADAGQAVYLGQEVGVGVVVGAATNNVAIDGTIALVSSRLSLSATPASTTDTRLVAIAGTATAGGGSLSIIGGAGSAATAFDAGMVTVAGGDATRVLGVAGNVLVTGGDYLSTLPGDNTGGHAGNLILSGGGLVASASPNSTAGSVKLDAGDANGNINGEGHIVIGGQHAKEVIIGHGASETYLRSVATFVGATGQPGVITHSVDTAVSDIVVRGQNAELSTASSGHLYLSGGFNEAVVPSPATSGEVRVGAADILGNSSSTNVRVGDLTPGSFTALGSARTVVLSPSLEFGRYDYVASGTASYDVYTPPTSSTLGSIAVTTSSIPIMAITQPLNGSSDGQLVLGAVPAAVGIAKTYIKGNEVIIGNSPLTTTTIGTTGSTLVLGDGAADVYLGSNVTGTLHLGLAAADVDLGDGATAVHLGDSAAHVVIAVASPLVDIADTAATVNIGHAVSTTLDIGTDAAAVNIGVATSSGAVTSVTIAEQATNVAIGEAVTGSVKVGEDAAVIELGVATSGVKPIFIGGDNGYSSVTFFRPPAASTTHYVNLDLFMYGGSLYPRFASNSSILFQSATSGAFSVDMDAIQFTQGVTNFGGLYRNRSGSDMIDLIGYEEVGASILVHGSYASIGGAIAGAVTVAGGTSTVGVGGALTLTSGPGLNSGAVNIHSAHSSDASSGTAGPVNITVGDSAGPGAALTLTAGDSLLSSSGGDVTITSGSSAGGFSGNVVLTTGTGAQRGTVEVGAELVAKDLFHVSDGSAIVGTIGQHLNGSTPELYVISADAPSNAVPGSSLALKAGNSAYSSLPGTVSVDGGIGGTSGGDIVLTGGDATTANGVPGAVRLEAGSCTSTPCGSRVVSIGTNADTEVYIGHDTGTTTTSGTAIFLDSIQSTSFHITHDPALVTLGPDHGSEVTVILTGGSSATAGNVAGHLYLMGGGATGPADYGSVVLGRGSPIPEMSTDILPHFYVVHETRFYQQVLLNGSSSARVVSGAPITGAAAPDVTFAGTEVLSGAFAGGNLYITGGSIHTAGFSGGDVYINGGANTADPTRNGAVHIGDASSAVYFAPSTLYVGSATAASMVTIPAGPAPVGLQISGQSNTASGVNGGDVSIFGGSSVSSVAGTVFIGSNGGNGPTKHVRIGMNSGTLATDKLFIDGIDLVTTVETISFAALSRHSLGGPLPLTHAPDPSVDAQITISPSTGSLTLTSPNQVLLSSPKLQLGVELSTTDRVFLFGKDATHGLQISHTSTPAILFHSPEKIVVDSSSAVDLTATGLITIESSSGALALESTAADVSLTAATTVDLSSGSTLALKATTSVKLDTPLIQLAPSGNTIYPLLQFSNGLTSNSRQVLHAKADFYSDSTFATPAAGVLHISATQAASAGSSIYLSATHTAHSGPAAHEGSGTTEIILDAERIRLGSPSTPIIYPNVPGYTYHTGPGMLNFPIWSDLPLRCLTGDVFLLHNGGNLTLMMCIYDGSGTVSFVPLGNNVTTTIPADRGTVDV